ncbi:FRG domain-containing protein [Paenibacillus foliorum]|uniref:FRG domain-containing protein n=1 Tax=Paenibacillus foliorum TaxID=2654974 RepID=UPI001492077C|nr:FRG domain-containing protein [Paenibacillus foliorum]
MVTTRTEENKFVKLARGNYKDGFTEFEIKDFSEFNELVCDELLDIPNYIWRGQRDSEWLLESTLSRTIKGIVDDEENVNSYINNHLKNFKYATRGRRGFNPAKLTEEEWWALGQHHGLDTPLLDWSISPYVAAFFAFSEEAKSTDGFRAIYAFNKPEIEMKSEEILEDPSCGNEDIIRFINPLTDENQRLVNQSGLFTLGPISVDLKSWICNNFKNDTRRQRLMKIKVPDEQREMFLKALNRMNINHLTLFPDLTGASLYCNLSSKIKNY